MIAEELQVVIRAEAEKAIRDLKRFGDTVDGASGGLKSFGERAAKVGGNMTRMITGPILAVGAAFTAATIEAGNYADKILDLNQITGLSTDYLQELEHVAMVAGVSFEGLTGVIQRFTARLPSIESESSEASHAFKRLGVDLRNTQGEIRDMNDLFPELIGALQDVDNITERNALAQQIFGRSLNDLAPVLGMTADELERAKDASKEFLRSEEELRAANEYRIAIGELGRAVQSLWRDLAQELMPVLKESVIPALRDAAGVAADVVKWFGSLDQGTQKLIMSAGLAAAALGPAIGLAGKAMSAAAAVKGLAVAFGLTNPIVAAFLVTITAVAAAVGYLVHRVRTAEQENRLLADAISGSVTSMEEYEEALEILGRKEDQQQKVIDQTTEALRREREELARLKEAEQKGRAAGYDESLLAAPLRAQEELNARIAETEAHLKRVTDARSGEREAIEANRAALEKDLEERARLEEQARIAELVSRQKAFQEALDREAAAAMGAADDVAGARVDAEGDANGEIQEEARRHYRAIGDIAATAHDEQVMAYERALDAQHGWAREREYQHNQDLLNLANERYEREHDARIRWAWAAQDEITAMYESAAVGFQFPTGAAAPSPVIEAGVHRGVDGADWVSIGNDVAREFGRMLEGETSIFDAIQDVRWGITEGILDAYIPGMGMLAQQLRGLFRQHILDPILNWAQDLTGWGTYDPVSDFNRQWEEYQDDLHRLLREEIKIRDEALRELDRHMRTEWTVLADLFDRNIITAAEFMDIANQMNEAYTDKAAEISQPVEDIQQQIDNSEYDRHMAEIAAAQAELARWEAELDSLKWWQGVKKDTARMQITFLEAILEDLFANTPENLNASSGTHTDRRGFGWLKPGISSGPSTSVHIHIEGDNYGIDDLAVKVQDSLRQAEVRGVVV